MWQKFAAFTHYNPMPASIRFLNKTKSTRTNKQSAFRPVKRLKFREYKKNGDFLDLSFSTAASTGCLFTDEEPAFPSSF